MDTVFSFFEAVLPSVKAHPYVAVAVTVAGVVVVAQPLLRALVRWTPNEVDDKILEVVLRVADILTPQSTLRGARAVPASDADIVANIAKKYAGAAKVPAYVMATMTEAQRELLADRYAAEATEP